MAAVFHHLVGPTGKVVGIDHIPELVDWSISNLKNDGLGDALDKKGIEVVAGDGRKGYPSGGRFLISFTLSLVLHLTFTSYHSL